MNQNFIIRHSSALLNSLLNRDKSVAYVTKSYFKANKGIGSKERQIINELTFFSLRNYLLLEEINKLFFISKSDHSLIFASLTLISSNFDELTADLINFHLAKISGAGDFDAFFIGYILNELDDPEIFTKTDLFLENLQKDIFNHNFDALSLYYSVSKDIIVSLSQLFDFDDISAYLRGLNTRASVQIRINTLKSDKNKLIKSLENIVADNHNYASDTALALKERVNATQLPEYLNGDFEFQSDGSQIISLLSYQKHFNSILDACAGAGGKSLHLAALSQNLTEIIALDIDRKKIEELRKRALRNGVTSIKSYTLNYFNKTEESKRKFDLVLIDAPCSATGNSQRDPSKKLFLNKKKIINYQSYQLTTLKYYAKFVNNQGILVYATCSVLPEENEYVVENFLRKNDEFSLFEPNESLDYYNLRHKLSSGKSGFYRVHPLHNQTDGFFIALLQKKGKNA